VDGCDGSENLLVVILQSSTVLAQYEKGRNETTPLCIKLLSYATCKSNGGRSPSRRAKITVHLKATTSCKLI